MVCSSRHSSIVPYFKISGVVIYSIPYTIINECSLCSSTNWCMADLLKFSQNIELQRYTAATLLLLLFSEYIQRVQFMLCNRVLYYLNAVYEQLKKGANQPPPLLRLPPPPSTSLAIDNGKRIQTVTRYTHSI